MPEGSPLRPRRKLLALATEADAIQGIAQKTDWSTLDAWAIPARPVLEVAQGVVLARAAQAEGDNNAASLRGQRPPTPRTRSHIWNRRSGIIR